MKYKWYIYSIHRRLFSVCLALHIALNFPLNFESNLFISDMPTHIHNVKKGNVCFLSHGCINSQNVCVEQIYQIEFIVAYI